MQPSYFRRRGFTLVELLVVIAIIGVLVAVLLPAVQAAREAGRRTQCLNNLRNIGLAFANHLDVHKQYPTGGWGWIWAGDPDRGFGLRQPGGWMYNILPYMEEQALHDLGKGLASEPKKKAAQQVVQSPLAWAVCPTRRTADLFPVPWGDNCSNPCVNVAAPLPGCQAARSDYVVNASDRGPNEHGGGGPSSYADGDKGNFFWRNTRCPGGEPAMCGISFERSAVKLRDVKDGVSKTYLVGEKYLNRLKYGSGNDAADNEWWNVGFDNDMYRTADKEPASDGQVLNAAGVPQDDSNRYGSSHEQAFHMVMGDASVKRIPYEVDLTLHRRLANRADGLPAQVP